MTYDLLDRRLTEVQPRAQGVTVTQSWQYDPAGNVLAVVRPGRLDTSSSGLSSSLVVDGSQHPQSNPYVLTGTSNSYTSVTLQNGGWISTSAYNGSSGGEVDLIASGSLTICSTCGITVAGLGPAGGSASTSGSGANGTGVGPGGGGQAGMLNGTLSVAGAGGGGGHASSGTSGQNDPSAAGADLGSGGHGGASYGLSDLSDSNVLDAMGSGGGAGGPTLGQAGGSGGAGGGFVRITAQTIDDEGTIEADGASGTSVSVAAGGGGGSGGAVWLSAQSVTLGNGSAITVAGGAGGTGANGVNGGAGASGRVRIDADSVSGSGYTPSSWGSSYNDITSRITAYSYDNDNRVVDTVTGASNTNASLAGTSSGTGNMRTRVMYDTDGHIVARFDPRAFATSTSNPDTLFMVRTDYDVDGRPITQYVPRYDNSDDSGRYSDMGLSGLSSTQSLQCPTGVTPQSLPGIPSYPAGAGICKTQVTYDADGNRASLTMPTITTSSTSYFTYTYTDDNLIASVSAPDPSNPGSRLTASQSYAYDAADRLLTTTDANNDTQSTSYYADGLPRTKTGQPNGSLTHVTTYGYDANGNQTSVQDPAGNVSTSVYYADNQLQYTQDAAGERTTYTYDGVGNPQTVLSPSGYAKDSSNPNGAVTQYSYTWDNLLLSITTPFQSVSGTKHQTTYSYDQAGRKTSQHAVLLSSTGAVLQDGGTQSFSYYDNDLVASQVGRNGETITSSYDAAGNPTSITDSTSGVTLTSTYYVDDLARSVDDGGRTTQYLYDGAESRALRVDQVDGSGTRYTTSYTYNPAELPSSMSSTAVQSGSTAWTYDVKGRPATETDPNGERISWTFNPDDTLQVQTLASSSGSTLAKWTYGYDQDYRITSQAFEGQAAASNGGSFVADTFSYTYDAASRLKTFVNASGTTTYTWDHDGNRTQVTPPVGSVQSFSYNADDSMASSPQDSSFSYNAMGGLLNDGCSTYSYDGFDRTASVIPISGRPSTCGTSAAASYTYDGLDRQHTHTDSGTTTTMRYDGGATTVAIETSSSNVDTVYELDPAREVKGLTVESGAPTTQYLTSDGHGNIATVTSTGQSVACTVRYDSFGGPLGTAPNTTNVCNTGSTPNDVFYRGGRHDASTGDYQFGGRTYDPSKAGFTTPDSYRGGQPTDDLSVGTDPLTQNRYSYVNGDPINLVDLNGHDPWYNDQPPKDTPPSSPKNHYVWSLNCGYTPYDQQEQADLAAQEEVYQRKLAAEEQARKNSCDHWWCHPLDTLKSVASTAWHGVTAVIHYCTSSWSGGSTCLAIVGSVALAATGVGAGAGAALIGETAAGALETAGSAALAGSRIAGAISFTQTHNPLDLASFLPVGAVSKLAGKVLGATVGAVGARVGGALAKAADSLGGASVVTRAARAGEAGAVRLGRGVKGVAGAIRGGLAHTSAKDTTWLPTTEDLSRAAGAPDRNGFTAAGRALQKHGNRPGSAFPNLGNNPADLNPAGQTIADAILNDPAATIQTGANRRVGNYFDVIASDGRGIRYRTDGSFVGFLEP